MFNKIIVLGRLTRDPELKYTATGVALCKISLAVNRSFKDANGNYPVDFFSVTLWRKLAEISGQYLKKGKLVLIEGEMQSNSYTDQNGIKKTFWDIQASTMKMMPEGKKDNNGQQEAHEEHQEFEAPPQTTDDVDFSDVPF